jgi:hypothetical protein
MEMVDLRGDFSNRLLRTLEEWNHLLKETSLGQSEPPDPEICPD